MNEATPRFQLPFILPGQAQKELFHNEALTRIELALQPAVEAADVEEPPTDPQAGQCWLLGGAPTGAWGGNAHRLAMWTEGGWRFLAPGEGFTVWDKSEARPLRRSNSGWTGQIAASHFSVAGQQVVGERQPAVPSPSGGTVIDVETRAATVALIAALMSHGLIY
jgi:hypothetical protein